MPARNDMHGFPHVLQMLNQCDDSWRLAGAARIDVSHTNDRNIRGICGGLCHPPGGGHSIQRAQRCQHPRHHGWLVGWGEPKKRCAHYFAPITSSVSCTRSKILSVTPALCEATSQAACAMVADWSDGIRRCTAVAKVSRSRTMRAAPASTNRE